MALLAILPSILRSRAAVELENLALRHQIGVLQRSAAKRLKLTSGDRLLWICLSRLWRDWRSALAIVKPETVLAWHRADFRLFWTSLRTTRCLKKPKPIALRAASPWAFEICAQTVSLGCAHRRISFIRLRHSRKPVGSSISFQDKTSAMGCIEFSGRTVPNYCGRQPGLRSFETS